MTVFILQDTFLFQVFNKTKKKLREKPSVYDSSDFIKLLLDILTDSFFLNNFSIFVMLAFCCCQFQDRNWILKQFYTIENLNVYKIESFYYFI